MPIIAVENERKEFTQVSLGTVQAVCYDVWDIGHQETPYEDEEGNKIVQHKVVVAFEVNEVVKEGKFEGKRMTINRFYTLSLGEKANLRKDLESWRGKSFTEAELKGFDIESLIGVNAMLSIVHNEKGKAKISNISKLMNGLPEMHPENGRTNPNWIIELQKKGGEPIPF